MLLPVSVRAMEPLRQFDDILNTSLPSGEGWGGFSEYDFLLKAALTLALAAVLGAVIAYHPRRIRAADTVEEIEAPKVSIVYGVIGALTGILVVQYGVGVGFVLFGLGGLMRFRTAMRSAGLTGQVIFVTVIGLACGLDLPHVAVLSTVFGWILVFILEARIIYQVDIRGIDPERLGEAAQAYRQVLEASGCRVLAEKKRPAQGRVRFILRDARSNMRDRVEGLLSQEIDPGLRGTMDWEVD